MITVVFLRWAIAKHSHRELAFITLANNLPWGRCKTGKIVFFSFIRQAIAPCKL
ncbi:hypothetical protein [Cylindrospermopsis curvispora]|uniref:Uncharacterized protein n=1 Tax=Cylindrospermopsis curvispora GIHE-G1 TaxID=2666332 RepID=A0A7H0EYH9_9CYAN|nr:hypothetical protein [Cylindrospermopsis curvispora]QNP28845.1 hypothetical protein IAR63_13320 [Cylindrospermopsis curvispora GIHE-G1]